MTHRDEPTPDDTTDGDSQDPQSDDTTDDAGGADGGGGWMRARTWTIAANYRSPADYDIPTAPTFTAERRADGTLVLLSGEEGGLVLTAGRPSTVRR